jgi:UDP-N-acetylglucosamine--N-acetylmuramyl-(pentapeptide) pyrophosphoryl-undecaprenol N-acetylglucosamine transferase
MWKARKIVREFKPNIAIGVGGYASGPVMKAALNQDVATLIQEQNSYAGVTNKLLGSKVDRVCVAYDRMEDFFPAKKLLFTGNPVRKDLMNVDKLRSSAYKRFEFDPMKQTIVILGGSLGARTLNVAMRDNTDFFVRHPQIQVIWQCGKYYFEEYATCATALLPQVKIMAFIAEMDIAYAIADVIVARAGALTISELCLVGKPAILVPSPNVAEDHQTKNALSLVQKNAAILVKDSEASEKMLEEALFILNNTSLAFGMAERIRTLARPNAANDIAEEAIQLGKKNAKKKKNAKQ